MNVTCAVLNGLKQNQVHKFDNRRLIGEVRHEPFVVRSAGLAHSARNILIGAKFLKNLGEVFVFFLGVILVDGFFDLSRVGHHHLHFALDGEMDFICARRVQRIDQRHLHRSIVLGNRHAMIHPHDIWRNRL